MTVPRQDSDGSWPRVGTPQSVVDTVYEALTEGIVSGVIAPGDRLREADVAKRLGVSATPVREALRRLEWIGLAEVHPRRGAVVSRFDARAIREALDIRAVLEAAFARTAAETGPHDWTYVDQLLAEGDLVRGDPMTFSRLDTQFHQALVDLAGNKTLSQLVKPIYARSEAARTRMAPYLDDERTRHSHRHHVRIVAAIKKGDPDAAEAAAQAHHAHARKVIEQVLAKMQRDEPRQAQTRG